MPYKVEYPRYENEAVLCCCCACFITVEMLLCYAVAGWKRNEAAAVMLLVGKEMKMKILLCMIYMFAFLLQGLSCY
jgi:hypothetical protein